jgi:sulfite exporter TauE/SafE
VSDLALVFLAGLAGSMHCIGMCGGFACGLGPDSRGHAATLRRHLVYNLGRLTSYAFLGTVCGHLGLLLVGHDGQPSTASMAQRALALASGALMVFIGLQFTGLVGHARHPLRGFGSEGLAHALRTLLSAPGLGAPLAFGVLNGLLPCPLVYAFAAQAAASGTAASGLAVMVAFGLGTFPAMLAMGGIGWWWRGEPPPSMEATTAGAGAVPRPVLFTRQGRTVVRADWRARGLRLAGAFIVLLGLITIARGVLPMSAHLH